MRVPTGWLRRVRRPRPVRRRRRTSRPLWSGRAGGGGDPRRRPRRPDRRRPRARPSSEPQKNGKTIRWCQVDVGRTADGADGGTPRGIVCGAHELRGRRPRRRGAARRRPARRVRDRRPQDLRPRLRRDDLLRSASSASATTTPASSCSHDRLRRRRGRAPGADAIALLGLDEEVLEVNVTPDRGYCFTLRGIAREYAHGRPAAAFRDPAAVDAAARPTAPGYAVRLEDAAPAATGTSAATATSPGSSAASTPSAAVAVLDAAPAAAGRDAADLARRRRHQLRDACHRAAAARLRPRRRSAGRSSCAAPRPGSG